MRPELEKLQTTDSGEAELRTGLDYGPDDPVVLRVRKRDGRYDMDDAGAAVRLTGHPDGWQDVAAGLVTAHGLSINPDGVVFILEVEARDVDALTLSVADTSLALYSALRQPDLAVGFDSDTSVE
jgi:hypothetical protein